MSETSPTEFINCLNCGAQYKVARVEAPPGPTTDREITCLNCGGPLNGREGDFLFKYVLISKLRRGIVAQSSRKVLKVGAQEFHVRSSDSVPEDKSTLRYEFEPTGKPDIAKGKGTPGHARLYINDKLVGQTDFPFNYRPPFVDPDRRGDRLDERDAIEMFLTESLTALPTASPRLCKPSAEAGSTPENSF
jgi:hypothetical protein